MYKHPLINRDKMTPQEALTLLIEGNERFSNNQTEHKDLRTLVDLTQHAQHPFAAILSCSDSRAPTEFIFDQALGDIFSVRLAGNIASRKAIGSLEFSCKYLGSKLVVVLGHSSCGAVQAACDGYEGGHIGDITQLIKPAVQLETTVVDNRASSNKDFLAKVCELNVDVQIKQILLRSTILQEMLAKKQIGLVGGVYDLATAKVKFIENDVIF
ncbi:MAG TPA: carbonic anhydrase [Methylotenera sp.]|nr:carbonic anhydrase [Methylotenera sp.]